MFPGELLMGLQDPVQLGMRCTRAALGGRVNSADSAALHCCSAALRPMETTDCTELHCGRVHIGSLLPEYIQKCSPIKTLMCSDIHDRVGGIDFRVNLFQSSLEIAIFRLY